MTNTTMNLQDLLEKTTDPDFLREMIGYTAHGTRRRGRDRRRAHRSQLGAARATRRLSGPGLAYPGRNRRPSHPEAKKRQLFSRFLEPRRMSEKALTAVIQEAQPKAPPPARSTSSFKP
jgi:putative transposase